ncbi:MAG: hypothetical protein GY811_27705 [Myxococcales bacterium]|nr:hypothetical protein [Myxococcales bacterium]
MPRLKPTSLILTRSLLAVPLSLGLVACDSGSNGAAPSTVQQRLHSTLPGLIESSASAMAFLAHSENASGLGESLDGITSVLGLSYEDELEPLPAADGDEDELSGQEIADLLETELFNDTNYEGNGDYRIPAQLLCPDIEILDETSPDGFETQVDQDCIDSVTQVEPRIHAEAAGNGLDLSLLVGPQRSAPLTLELREDSVAIATDLSEAKAAAEHLARVAGEDFELPEVMEGIAAAKLTVHGPEYVSVALSIRESLNIVASLPGTGALSFSSETADPLVDVRINGTQQELSALLALGRTRFSMPMSAFDEESTLNGLLAIDWQGLSAAMLLTEGSEGGITIDNVGLGGGQSAIKLDDTTLFSVDLNADAGRHFSLTIAPGIDAALPSFHFGPGFSLELGVDLTPLADAGEDVPGYFLGETYSFEVESGAQLVEGLDEGGIMAQGGSIRLSSGAGTDDIAVLEGQCLLGSEVEDGEHELLGALTSGACPQ